MLAARPISKDLISKHLQVHAQSDLEQARLYKTQSVELALTFYDRAKVTFRNMASACHVVPFSTIKNAVSGARAPQTSEDESLRRYIAEVYFERAEILKDLGKRDKAKKSYEKAQAWSYECLADPISTLKSATSPPPPPYRIFSYACKFFCQTFSTDRLVEISGIEPLTSCVTRRRATRLSLYLENWQLRY